MYLFRNLHDLKAANIKAIGTAVSIGNYDGLHLGHQRLLHQLREKARVLKVPTLVIIFEPQPGEYLYPQNAPRRLMTFTEKLVALREQGVDYVLCLRFNRKLVQLSAEDFVKNILIDALNIKYIIVGSDFVFGHNHAGDKNLLQKMGIDYGFQTEVMPDFYINEVRVSSTIIREALAAGDLVAAKKYLGKFYSITGRVEHGMQIGRDLGFPTANIYLYNKTFPLAGVYLVRIRDLGKQVYYGVANIGFKPTIIAAKPHQSLEVYLLDFNGDLYRKRITAEFLHKLRGEEKFIDLTMLREHIAKDVKAARAIVGKIAG